MYCHIFCFLQGFQAPDGVPLLHTAKPGGKELAGYICKVAEQPEAGSATAWAALACLQYATTDRGKVRCLTCMHTRYGMSLALCNHPNSSSVSVDGHMLLLLRTIA